MATIHIRRGASPPPAGDDASNHPVVSGPAGIAFAWAGIGIGGIAVMLAVDTLVAWML
jgi:hypothetical protein